VILPAPRVYLVTDRHATHGRPLPEVVARALGALGRRGHVDGATLAVQLRDKDLGGLALLDLGRALRRLTAEAGVRLYVNDRVDVALACGADGVHLGGGALSPAEARSLAPGLAIAVSTHAPDEVARAAAGGAVSFAVFGPVFDTPSKRAFGPPPGLAALTAACATTLPVLALGGVDATNAGDCRAAGAAGVACIRAVFGAPDPQAALADLLEAMDRPR
jgi:thiamine-phosphate pyrophosphorylase